MNYEWAHRLAKMAGLELEHKLKIWGSGSSVAARAAFCVGYDRYMDQAVKGRN